MEAASLVGLFTSSFLSASVLPGSSEIIFVTMILNEAAPAWTVLWVATIGNTLGGIATFILGGHNQEGAPIIKCVETGRTPVS